MHRCSPVLSSPSTSLNTGEARMPTLDRNGVTIYYEVHGNGSRRSALARL